MSYAWDVFVHLIAAERVYSFPVFTEDFCRELIEELIHFEQSDLPKGRPNTMNNYGVRRITTVTFYVLSNAIRISHNTSGWYEKQLNIRILPPRNLLLSIAKEYSTLGLWGSIPFLVRLFCKVTFLMGTMYILLGYLNLAFLIFSPSILLKNSLGFK